jgi:hypothetical protein
MTKKSALTMAAGLAIALLVGVAAMTLTFGGTSVANATRQHKPIVKHEVQTVTVHRKNDAPSSGGVRVVHLSSTDPTLSSGSDDAFEDGANDDAFENEANDAPDDGQSSGSSSMNQCTSGDD